MHNIAENIISKFGGHQRIADILGLDVSRIYRWTYPKERGGTEGIIPARHQQVLLNKAEEVGVDLRPQDFFEAPMERDGNANA